jgi:chromosome segregation ATPase
MIEESVGMATINDAERGDSDEEDENDDDESEPEGESAKEQRPTRTTVERLRTPREKITEQISQRDKIMTQVSSALERSNATDLSSTLEKVSIIQMLQNQVQAEQARCRQLEVDYRALREKYDTKVAEVQEKAAEISKLELRLFMAGVQTPQARNGTPGALPWSSPVGNRGLGLSNVVGDREEQQ